MPAKGLIIAAPASGCGKTLVTLALLRRLKRAGKRVVGVKAGPDYIDPMFHTAACGRPCHNLDVWAMRHQTLASVISGCDTDGDLVIAEGVMGLFDGINLPDRPDAGSTADLAAVTGWPVVLVIDAGRQAASAGALLRGFAMHRDDVSIAGVIFNRVGSAAHRSVLAAAAEAATPEITLLGFIPREPALTLPDRHLGLVPAGEHAGLDEFLDLAADRIGDALDLDALTALAKHSTGSFTDAISCVSAPLPPLGQRIAVARDTAFSFAYDAILEGWRDAGAEVSTFSPLANGSPDETADAIYLPGGYPELHAGQLAAADDFHTGLHEAAGRGVTIFGECGGYMALGEGLVDAQGVRHEMTGLLPLETSFAGRKLHLGYRTARLCAAHPLGNANTEFRGHEFHYATTLREGPGQALFQATSARRDDLGTTGLVAGSVSGSFIHLIDRTEA